MAHIQDRGKDVERRWQARYRDPDGNERTKAFRRKGDAQRWIDEKTADMLTGRYVDPKAGRVRLEAYAREWFAAQTFEATSRQTVEPRLGHIIDHLGGVQLANLRPSAIQAWLRKLQGDLSPRYVGQILTTLSTVLSAAVDDGRIASNPCAAGSVKAPSVDSRKVVPWSIEQVQAIVEAHPDEFAALAILAAGCGLRQGETFGLRVDDVDFLRRRLMVRRQVRLIRGRPVFAPPKGGKERTVPLPDVVSVALAEQLRRWPPTETTLPWRDRTGEATTETLVFAGGGGAIVRNDYNRNVWRPALEAVGIEPSRATGMHALRHHFASVVLDAGVSIRALAEYLGHSDPGFTLRTYAHMMPASEDRARAAIDAAHSAPAECRRNARGR